MIQLSKIIVIIIIIVIKWSSDEFNTSLSIVDRIKQKIIKEIRGLERHYKPNGPTR